MAGQNHVFRPGLDRSDIGVGLAWCAEQPQYASVVHGDHPVMGESYPHGWGSNSTMMMRWHFSTPPAFQPAKGDGVSPPLAQFWWTAPAMQQTGAKVPKPCTGGYTVATRKPATKKPNLANWANLLILLEEREGFEPSLPCGKPDFESGTFNHSAIAPGVLSCHVCHRHTGRHSSRPPSTTFTHPFILPMFLSDPCHPCRVARFRGL